MGEIMKKLLNLIEIIIFIGVCTFVYLHFNDIEILIQRYIDEYTIKTRPAPNEYAKKIDYDYVQIYDKYKIYNYKDLLNVIYTTIDYGYDEVTFYCDKEYINCINDIEVIANPKSSELISNISNHTSPLNSVKTILFKYNSYGKIILNVNYKYTLEERKYIVKTIDEIWNEIITPNMTTKQIIKVFHDYIINNTKYDINFSYELEPYGESSKATGLLKHHLSVCSGYADTMGVVLDKLGLENFRISTTNHVWNAVKLDNKYYHLDLTWDDPTTDTGKDLLLYDYYLITTDQLKKIDKDKKHEFNPVYYQELK